jgi:hypothetical protein
MTKCGTRIFAVRKFERQLTDSFMKFLRIVSLLVSVTFLLAAYAVKRLFSGINRLVATLRENRAVRVVFMGTENFIDSWWFVRALFLVATGIYMFICYTIIFFFASVFSVFLDDTGAFREQLAANHNEAIWSLVGRLIPLDALAVLLLLPAAAIWLIAELAHYWYKKRQAASNKTDVIPPPRRQP